MKPIAIIGEGGHSKVIRDLIELAGEYEIISILDDKYDEPVILKGIIFASISHARQLIAEKNPYFFVAIGDNAARKKIDEELLNAGAHFAALIHPSAVISQSARVGAGTAVLANSVVNADAVIGRHAILNSSSVIEHDNRIGDYAHISPGAVLAGNVQVGNGTHIGAGAAVIPGKRIGEWSIVGAGSVINRDLPDYVTAVGAPARVIKSPDQNEVKRMAEPSKIFLSPPHMSGEEQKYINEAFQTNWIAPLGPHVDAFEKELAEYAGVRDAVAVSSGTAAIHLGLRLLDVQQGDVVFCSSLTFVASANPVLYQGAEPVFIDSEPDSWNMSPAALEEAMIRAVNTGKLPKAAIIVNLYGQSAKMEELLAICNHYDVPVIEDAAESLGAEYQGQKSGTFGKFGVYSFNGNKIITTSGGGMLVSNDEEALQKARFLAAQARDSAAHYQHSQIGNNYRMSNILAGVGRAQLKVLDERVKARQEIFLRYKEALGNIEGITFMPELRNAMHNRWLTTLTIDAEKLGVTPMDVINALADKNIEARPVWKPLHLQPLFKGAEYFSHTSTKSVSEELFNTGICLPSGSNLTGKQQERVIESVLGVCQSPLKLVSQKSL